MAATINVDLDVDQAKFLAFYSAFERFSKGLDGAAGKWGKINAEMQDAARSSNALVEQSSEASENVEKARAAIFSLKPVTETISRGWGVLATNTQKVAVNIKEATIALLKWSGISALIGGVGTWGLTELGKNVTSERSAAMGAGTSYGSRQAFNVAFGRFGDAEGVLGRVSRIQAQADHTALRALGLSEEEIRTLDPAELAARAYGALGRGARQQPKGQLGDWMRSRRIDEVFDLGQARQAGEASGTGEMGELQEAFRKNRGRFNLSDESQRAWAKFTMQMEISSAIIKKTFAGALGKLTPSLARLSQSFTALIEKLMREDGPLGRALESFSKWLDETIKTVDDKKLRQWFDAFFEGVKNLVTTTGAFLRGLADVLRWFGVTPAAAATMDSQRGGAFSSGGEPGVGAQEGGGASGRAASGSTTQRGSGGSSGGATGGASGTAPSGVTTNGVGGASGVKEAIDRSAKKYGVNPRTMYGIVAGESGHREDFDVGDHGTSFGPFQFHDAGPGSVGYEFRKETGLDHRDPKNIPAMADFTAKWIAKHRSVSPWHGYHGDRDWNPRWGNMGYKGAQAPQKTRVTIHRAIGNDSSEAANALSHATP